MFARPQVWVCVVASVMSGCGLPPGTGRIAISEKNVPRPVTQRGAPFTEGLGSQAINSALTEGMVKEGYKEITVIVQSDIFEKKEFRVRFKPQEKCSVAGVIIRLNGLPQYADPRRLRILRRPAVAQSRKSMLMHMKCFKRKVPICPSRMRTLPRLFLSEFMRFDDRMTSGLSVIGRKSPRS